MNIILDENGNEIKFKAIKHTLKQAADEVGVADSTIRFWTKRFEEFLDIDNKNWKKEYTDRDIYVFKFIQKSTREDRLTIDQTKDLLKLEYRQISKVQFDEDAFDKSNDVALNKAIDSRLNDFKSDIVEEISKSIEERLTDILMKHFISVEDTIKESYSSTVEKMEQIKSEVEITIEDHTKGINETLDAMQDSIKQRDLETTSIMREILNQRRLEFEQHQDSQKGKGFFARIFSK